MREVLVDSGATELLPLNAAELDTWLARQSGATQAWVVANGFAAEAGTVCPIPGGDGGIVQVLVGSGDETDPWAFAGLPAKLPMGTFRFGTPLSSRTAEWAATAWMLATYAFNRYKGGDGREWPRLAWPEGVDRARVLRTVEAVWLVRDLINVPAADLGPAELAQAAETLAANHGAQVTVIVGDALLDRGYPAVHAVGRAAAAHRRPRMIDLTWGDVDAPKVTLVGKGVCFDSGGLDLKTSSGMKLMKKDMGGAAHVLGLAGMVMAAKLPVRLRVLIPAVENAVSGDAMRPLDVLKTRKGISVEIGNTDAEGRLILADALAAASEEKPAVIIDFATLTGAARTALGTDLPALFCNDDGLADDILASGTAEGDPLWRMPLHKPYRRMLDGKVADLCSISDSPYAGAIVAALFLQEFVMPGVPWAHVDLMAWNTVSRPGRPEGGEAMALRAIYRAIETRFSSKRSLAG